MYANSHNTITVTCGLYVMRFYNKEKSKFMTLTSLIDDHSRAAEVIVIVMVHKQVHAWHILYLWIIGHERDDIGQWTTGMDMNIP